MKAWSRISAATLNRTGRLFVWLALTLLVACSNAPYRYEPFEKFDIAARAVTQSHESFQIRASVPGADQARQLLGIDVYQRNVQPVWLEIKNNYPTQARVVLSSIDPKYFPPAEVAYFFRKQFSKEGWMALEKRLIALSPPRFIPPGETASGFVFTNLSQGTKAFNVDIFEGSMPPSFEQFTFFLQVPGFKPDYANIRVGDLYSPDELIHVDEQSLANALDEMNCCTQNRDGSQRGRPIGLYIVSDPYDLLRSLLSAGWSETPAGRNEDSPEEEYYFLERPADGVFRKPRDRSADRSELDIWKTPLVVDGKPVWAGQLRHSIGRQFELGERLFGVRLDPDTNEGRNFVLQDFWYAQSLEQWGATSTGIVQPSSSPAQDFRGNPWFSNDGRQLVLWLSSSPVAMSDVRIVDLDANEPAEGGL